MSACVAWGGGTKAMWLKVTNGKQLCIQYMFILSYFPFQSNTSDIIFIRTAYRGSALKPSFSLPQRAGLIFISFKRIYLEIICNPFKNAFLIIFDPHHFHTIFPCFTEQTPASTIRATRSDRRWEGLEKRTLAMARKATGLAGHWFSRFLE